MDKNKFGNYIKNKRNEKGLTQKQLADLLVIDVTAVSKWERGISYPDITMIPEICMHLEVSEHELIASSNDTEYRAIKRDANTYRNIRSVIFYGFSIAYFIAVLTCFIVNLAVDHTLSWFFIVLTSCICGFTFIPTLTGFFEKNKLSVFVITTYLSMFLLFLTCSIYTADFWVWIAAVGTLLGYFAVFFPILFSNQKRYLIEEKYASLKRFFLLIYSAVIFALTVALLIVINSYAPFSLDLGLKIAAYCFIILFMYSIVEILTIRRMTKLGIDSILTAVYLFGLNGVLNLLLDGGENIVMYYRINFYDWLNCSDGNVTLIGVSALILAGIIMIIIGTKKKI